MLVPSATTVGKGLSALKQFLKGAGACLEIGYIIPRSEWDRRKPYLYHAEKRPYGEINSVGPSAAQVIHGVLKAMAEK